MNSLPNQSTQGVNFYQFTGGFQNIIDQPSLKWIFVGGKGGVGKTTISTTLSILLSQYRQKVLIISTVPAHNLSDAFNQKMGREPTLIKGYNNLYGLELDPTKEEPNVAKLNELLGLAPDENAKNVIKDLKNSFPGVDESLNLRYIASLVKDTNFDVVIFDTAPTGHTLRLLEMPTVLGKSLEKMSQIKAQFGTVLQGVATLFNKQFDTMFDKLFKSMDELRSSLETIGAMFKDPSKTTFVAVCIPEFLSVYETERLIQALFKEEIDIRNVVINQVLFQTNECRMCKARMKMQGKYIAQIKEMFEDFHITMVPLQKEEIRGVENLKAFSKYLLQ